MPESVSVKELLKAGDNLERAMIEKKKNVSGNVTSKFFWHLLSNSNFKTHSTIFCAEKKGKSTKVIDFTKQKRPGHLHRYQGISANVSFDAAEGEIRSGLRGVQAQLRRRPSAG